MKKAYYAKTFTLTMVIIFILTAFVYMLGTVYLKNTQTVLACDVPAFKASLVTKDEYRLEFMGKSVSVDKSKLRKASQLINAELAPDTLSAAVKATDYLCGVYDKVFGTYISEIFGEQF